MPFEPFINATNSRVSRLALLMIYRSRSIALNTNAVAQTGIQNGSRVLFHFDADIPAIGLSFTQERLAGAYRLSVKRGQARATADAFLRHYGIVVSQTVKCPLVWDEAVGLWVAEIPKEIVRPSD